MKALLLLFFVQISLSSLAQTRRANVTKVRCEFGFRPSGFLKVLFCYSKRTKKIVPCNRTSRPIIAVQRKKNGRFTNRGFIVRSQVIKRSKNQVVIDAFNVADNNSENQKFFEWISVKQTKNKRAELEVNFKSRKVKFDHSYAYARCQGLFD